jgi:rhodanese-related sulfurtransferase
MQFRKYVDVLSLLLIFQIGIMALGSCQSSEITRLSNKQFKNEASKENVVIIDVRTPDEFNTGHIKNAVLMDYLETDTFKKQIKSLDTTKTYILYCRSGKRSYNAAVIMKEHGFKKVSDLKEGISEWDGPVIKGSQ